MDLHRYAEAKALMRKTTPVARRAFGDSHDLALQTRRNYVRTLFRDPSATLDDLRESLEMLEDLERTARRVLATRIRPQTQYGAICNELEKSSAPANQALPKI